MSADLDEIEKVMATGSTMFITNTGLNRGWNTDIQSASRKVARAQNLREMTVFSPGMRSES